MATINLGSLKLNWTGAYNSSTSYSVDDIATANGNSYVCIQAHSNQAVGNATAYWNIMSSKGTDADLLNISSTAQGDLYYNSGSAIARVPKGTAGQVLQMNSGATAPEYGTVSSDYVKLLASDYSTAIANIDLDNIFSSTYRNYKIVIEDAFTAGSSFGELQMRYLNSSGAEISGSHYVGGMSGHYHSAGSSSGTVVGYDNNRSSARIGNWNLSNANEPYPNIWELHFGQMHLNAEHAFSFTAKVFDPDGNYDVALIGGHRYAQSSVTRGIRLMINGGYNFAGYKITVYGLK